MDYFIDIGCKKETIKDFSPNFNKRNESQERIFIRCHAHMGLETILYCKAKK